MAFDRPSPNFGPRQPEGADAKISMLVIHYTGMETCDAALQRLCDPSANVSAHYLIDEDGTVFDLVDDSQRAWHAGVSYWRGIEDVNSASIGIELVNPGHELGYRPFPDQQIEQLISLCQNVIGSNAIPASGIVGHSDVAPGRKTDPGELFPWSRMASAGIGLWPGNPRSTESRDPWSDLGKIGYAQPGDTRHGGHTLNPETGPQDVIAAFQRRFLPDNVTGKLDFETKGRIGTIAGLYD